MDGSNSTEFERVVACFVFFLLCNKSCDAQFRVICKKWNQAYFRNEQVYSIFPSFAYLVYKLTNVINKCKRNKNNNY